MFVRRWAFIGGVLLFVAGAFMPFVVRVAAGRALAGRLVQLQRRRGSRWVTVRRVRVGVHSSRQFRATLPKGRSSLRVTLSVNQAGAGFLGAISRAISVRTTR